MTFRVSVLVLALASAACVSDVPAPVQESEITHSIGGWNVKAWVRLICDGPCPDAVPIRALYFQNPRVTGDEIGAPGQVQLALVGRRSALDIIVPGEWETPPGRPATPPGQLKLEVRTTACSAVSEKLALGVANIDGELLTVDFGEVLLSCAEPLTLEPAVVGSIDRATAVQIAFRHLKLPADGNFEISANVIEGDWHVRIAARRGDAEVFNVVQIAPDGTVKGVFRSL